MKTDELINMLGTNLEPVKGGELRNALMIALTVGAAAASCLMLAIFGLPADALGDELVGARADPDRGGVTREDVCGVANALAPAQLEVLGPQDHRMAAELRHAGLERHPRTGRGLLEDQRHRAPLERVGLQRRGLQLDRTVQQRAQLLG